MPTGNSSLRLVATCSFGLEALVSSELDALGYQDLAVENGRVGFSAAPAAVARCNLWLRTSDRLLIALARFPASSFDELFVGVQGVAWEDFLPVDARLVVTARSVKSRLSSLPACQSTVKKAIIESLRRRHPGRWFAESGPLYGVEVSLHSDMATLTLDTSGEGLNRRGYRLKAGTAPLRETLAAALVLLSRWDPSRVLADPFCGSGTIAVEGALAGLGMAPGVRRSFSAEAWPHLPARLWQDARDEAREKAGESAGRNRPILEILASDRNPHMISLARENARRAGVEGAISWRVLPVERFFHRRPFGCLVCNPPYGERTGEGPEIEELYRSFGRTFSRLDRWSAFALTGHPEFERLFGERADRNRKLYNGNLKTYLYQYFGPLPSGEQSPAPEGQPSARAARERGATQQPVSRAAVPRASADRMFRARVVPGARRGHELGFPTANLELPPSQLPATGIYAVWVRIEGEEQWRPGAASVGYNPTFEMRRPQMEVHLLDYRREDLYGKVLEVVPAAYLRGEEKYDTPEALIEQIGRDCAQARALLAKAPKPGNPAGAGESAPAVPPRS